MVSIEYSEALVEILEILKNTDEDLVKKLPKKLIEFFERNASTTYKININSIDDLNNIELKEKTKDMIAMLYRNYWCDAQEREEYDEILRENEDKYQEELRKKYNPDNLFKKNEIVQEDSISNENIQMVEYKEEKIFSKMIKQIKEFFLQFIKKR